MKKAVHIVLALSIAGIISGGILAQFNRWATPLILANQKAATERAIFLVQPDGESYESVQDIDLEVYRVFDHEKRLIGYTLVYEGNGFQSKIRVMVGLSTDLTQITAMEILEQHETPGLGAQINEDFYKSQFVDLATTPAIEWVKGRPPAYPNQVQAITGATISSKAVVAIVNEGIGKLHLLQDKLR